MFSSHNIFFRNRGNLFCLPLCMVTGWYKSANPVVPYSGGSQPSPFNHTLVKLHTRGE